jgi:hypothetical protein
LTDKIPAEILELCARVTAKRAKTVVDHIIKHGYITTEDLKVTYGYDHPPRAIRDVREHGIPIETFPAVSSVTGRKIAGYRFGDPNQIRRGRFGGRIAFPKRFKNRLIEKYDSRSGLSNEQLAPRYLQIDHRIPYEVAGNSADIANLDEFMLLDASEQRAKSWSCEHCVNFLELRDEAVCRTCFWAFPEAFTHVAMKPERRLQLLWQGDEVSQYERLKNAAALLGVSVQDYVKTKLSNAESDA